MLSHEEIRQLISLYFDNEASNEEKDVVEEHILGCASCKAYYQQLSRIQTSLRAVADEDLSPDLVQKINRGFASARHREEEKMKKIPVRPIMVTAASFVIVLCVSMVTSQMYLTRSMQGRLKSSVDDIGEQYAVSEITQTAKPASVSAPSQTTAVVSGKVGEKDKLDQVSLAQGTRALVVTKVGEEKKESETLSQELRYEPYYLKNTYDRPQDAEKGALADHSVVFGIDGRTRAAAGYAYPAVPGEAKVLTRDEDGRFYSPYYYPIEKEEYGAFGENRFLTSVNHPLSTFSIDVDTAAYSNIRRFLNEGNLPPEDAVRIEEMINYFKYDYPKPSWNDPFSITTEVSQCPWAPDHQLVLIGLQGKVPDAKRLPPSHLVFLLDTSGSMADFNKLPLLKTAFLKLVEQMRAEDRITIVAYSSSARVILDSVPGDAKWQIRDAIEQLQADGSTAGWEGLQLAYNLAVRNFIPQGNNRVILATDGDFNVGPASDAEIVGLIQSKRQSGVFLTVLGLGSGNLKDCKLVQLADKGNGNYFYIDTPEEADKVFGKELGSTLFTIAKDVKIQVEFNPATVKAYRLLGYEKRKLANQDFNNDAIDAGEIGAGHTVTALYEIVSTEPQPWVVYKNGHPEVDPLKYQREPRAVPTKLTGSHDLLTVKIRYKEPDRDTSRLLERPVGPRYFTLWPESNNFRWAAAVAEFGLLLRNSPYKANASYAHVIQEASQAIGRDADGYRNQFIELVRRAQSLDTRPLRYIEDDYRSSNPEVLPDRYRNEEPVNIQFK